MTTKRDPSMIPRLTGKHGSRNLLAAVCEQQAVGGNTALAKRLISAGELKEHPAGTIVMRQGGTDSDIYMIIGGSVKVVINQREVAVRHGKSHVGEMAVLDPTARRSATIETLEKTVFLRIAEPEITRIGKDHPELWRRLALELGTRLRERTKFLTEPNPVPRLFIGSSSEALIQANYLHSTLGNRGIESTLWTKGVFQLSQTTIEDLVRASREHDFALLLLTPDDMVSSRGRRRSSPRDNVVFELGLFMGSLGRERTYLAVPRGMDIKLPTDLLGVTHAPYEHGHRRIGRKLAPVVRTVRQKILALGPK